MNSSFLRERLLYIISFLMAKFTNCKNMNLNRNSILKKRLSADPALRELKDAAKNAIKPRTHYTLAIPRSGIRT
jgi:hypothetical protein